VTQDQDRCRRLADIQCCIASRWQPVSGAELTDHQPAFGAAVLEFMMSRDDNASRIFRLHVNKDSDQRFQLCVGSISRAKDLELTYQFFHHRNHLIGRTAAHHRRIKDGATLKRWSYEWADFAI